MADKSMTKDQMKAILKSREDVIREQWIKAMEVRIVRDELVKCQQAEGVNAYYVCKDLAEKYVDMLKGKDHRVTGWRKVDV